jgi:hypothetical protein
MDVFPAKFRLSLVDLMNRKAAQAVYGEDDIR